MSYDYLSLKQADEIYHLVFNLSVQNSLDRVFISKSELYGYNFIDLSNALKLQIANKYLKSERKENIKNFAKFCDATLVEISEKVIPNEIFENLNKYDSRSIQYERKEDELRKITIHRKAFIEEFESCVSFLEFCESLRSFTNSLQLNIYWKEVYSHLNLDIDEKEIKSLSE